MPSVEISGSLRAISEELDRTQESREFLIKNMREPVRLCGRAIISVHKKEVVEARHLAAQAAELIASHKKKAVGDLQRHVILPEQELVEALSLIAIAERGDIPARDDLGVSPEAYVLGLMDCIGELKRLVFDRIRAGESADAQRVFGIMEDLYTALYPFAAFDKVLKESRRKLDVARILVEDARGAVTEEARRADLMEAIASMKKN